MAFNENDLLKEAYINIQKRFPGLLLDSFKVVSDVVCHRNFWKPPTVRTMLLAESHVYTPDNENIFEIDYSLKLQPYGIPGKFVRLVYCLAYGEDTLAPLIPKNSGTPQYWKIFAACASDTGEIDFGPVLKCAGNTDGERIFEKFKTLQKLRQKGVWLVDCSSVSLYGRGIERSSKQKRDILRICWETYICPLMEYTRPDFVIVVGKRVGRIVEPGLRKFGNQHIVLPQPQAWLSSKEQAEVLKTYQRICNRKSN